MPRFIPTFLPIAYDQGVVEILYNIFVGLNNLCTVWSIFDPQFQHIRSKLIGIVTQAKSKK